MRLQNYSGCHTSMMQVRAPIPHTCQARSLEILFTLGAQLLVEMEDVIAFSLVCNVVQILEVPRIIARADCANYNLRMFS